MSLHGPRGAQGSHSAELHESLTKRLCGDCHPPITHEPPPHVTFVLQTFCSLFYKKEYLSTSQNKLESIGGKKKKKARQIFKGPDMPLVYMEVIICVSGQFWFGQFKICEPGKGHAGE